MPTQQLKEGHARRLKEVTDADTVLEKTRIKYEQCSEEWEKSVAAEQQLHQQGSNTHSNGFGSGSTSTGEQHKNKYGLVSNPIMMLKVGIEKYSK
eukprot:jgi/Hompol1/1589/HPOL_002768-RA